MASRLPFHQWVLNRYPVGLDRLTNLEISHATPIPAYSWALINEWNRNYNYPMSYPQLQLPDSGKEEFTEYSRWRLLVNDGGRHTWHYLKTDEECERWPQNIVDKYWLGLPVVSERAFFPFHAI